MKCVRCGFEVEQSLPVCPYCGMGLKVDAAAQSRFSGPYGGQEGNVDQPGVSSQIGSSQMNVPPQREPQFNAPPQVEPQFNVPPQREPQFSAPPQVEPQFHVPPQREPQFHVPPQVEPQFHVPPQREPQFSVPPQRPQPQMNVPPMYGNMPAGQTAIHGGYSGQAANMADVKKDKYMPNIINIIAMLLAVIVAFLPYGFIAGRVNTIYSVFGIGSALFIMGILVAVTDIACAFVSKLFTDIVCLIESLFIGGLYITEFLLAVRDLKVMGGSITDGAYARLLWGSWASLVVAVLLILSVPLWLVIKKKKNNSR